jgi:plastocyanin
MRRLLSSILLVAVTLVACSDGDDSGASDVTIGDDFVDHQGQDALVITVRDNSFDDQHVVVSAGTEITFDNKGRNAHNALPVEDGAFEEVPTEDLQPGDAATVTFDEPGEYPYYCSLHGTESAGMVGTIVVAG